MCEIVCQLTFQMQMASVLLLSSSSIDKFAIDLMQTIMKWNLHFDAKNVLWNGNFLHQLWKMCWKNGPVHDANIVDIITLYVKLQNNTLL
jgi:hypothetical protein